MSNSKQANNCFNYEILTVATLRDLCGSRKLVSKGNKKTLINRLRTFDNNDGPNISNVVESTDSAEQCDLELENSAPSCKIESSRASDKSNEHASRVAKLKVDLQFFDKENELQIQNNKLKLQKELALAQAQLQVFSQGSGVEAVKETADNVADGVSLSPPQGTQGATDSADKQPENTSVSDSAPILFQPPSNVPATESVAFHWQAHKYPILEPPIFKGDPLEYPAWKSAFTILISNKSIPSTEKIHYLKRYLGGKALECVEGFFLLSTEESFCSAFQKIERRFGDPFLVGRAFRDKLHKWKRVSDNEDVRKFADFLVQCETAMKTITSLSSLNDSYEIHKVQSKLPLWLQSRWQTHAYEYQLKMDAFPSFSVFVSFLSKNADIICNPATAVTVNSNSNIRTTMATETDLCNPKVKKLSCQLCKGEHRLDDCSQFKERSFENRMKYVKSKRLCFNCLNANHMINDCRIKPLCKVCKRKHATSLHKPDSAKHSQDDTNVKCYNTCTSDVGDPDCNVKTSVVHYSVNQCTSTSLILPVYLSHKSNPSLEVLTYAILDSQSDSSFILDSIADQLNLSGPSVKLHLTTMSSKDATLQTQKINNLKLRGFQESKHIILNSAYSCPGIPANKHHIPTKDTVRHWPYLSTLEDQLAPSLDIDIGLLIGYDCAEALVPYKVILPQDGGPFAQKTILGWGIIGGNYSSKVSEASCHRVVTHRGTENQQSVGVMKSPSSEYLDNSSLKVSQQDLKFINILERGIKRQDDGRFEMPLPFKEQHIALPNNRGMVEARLKGLKRRLETNEEYKTEYFQFMDEMIECGYAEKCPERVALSGSKRWYIPHHGVYHPSKKKLRIVYDCSAEYQDTSLNNLLLKGPDLTNSLLGVFLRFRKYKVALVCDISKMFYQFKVPDSDRDFLRFLWWEDNDLSKDPIDYRMTVHIFGATSSPGCANFGLKAAAEFGEEQFGVLAANFIRDDFYVDDGLTSVPSEQEAIDLANNARDLCSKSGIRLHKFSSNRTTVIQSIPAEERAPELQKLDLSLDQVVERTLGVEWNLAEDAFKIKVSLKDLPVTRRGILSSINSIYDPLGFLAPFILGGKRVLQDICKEKIQWDSPLPPSISLKWSKWQHDLPILEALSVPRCFSSLEPCEWESVQLHHFADASIHGYGACSYLRFLDSRGNVQCSLCFAKARVTPVNYVSIPRLELMAALLASKVGHMLKRELKFTNVDEYFWTDSKVVLSYIQNESRRFHVFVANRVQQILDLSSPSQWNHVKSEDNPADLASRGLSANALLVSDMWFYGPSFLREPDLTSYLNQASSRDLEISLNDPEVKSGSTLVTVLQPYSSVISRLEFFSSWERLKRAVALCLKYKDILQKKKVNSNLKIDDLVRAELFIIKEVQMNKFSDEIRKLQNIRDSPDEYSSRSTKKTVLRSHGHLFKLDPFIDEDGLLRVGGRVRSDDMETRVKHPLILPKGHHISSLIIKYCHEQTHHQGRGLTLNELRISGFWVIGATSQVSKCIGQCSVCRKLRGVVVEQKMADLPDDRIASVPPFTNCAVDVFGPFLVKEGRKELKRYGVLYTCLMSRAVHVETVIDMSTDSFINSLRRLISIRGPISVLRCDNGSNFVGAANEFKENERKLDEEKIQRFLADKGCDFRFNVPSASHMGGVWERQIRSVRSVLTSILYEFGTQLDDESLRTFLCESAAIVNSRPLTVDNLADPSLEPLTPNHILTSKTKVIIPPIGDFVKPDIYLRKRWRRVQYLCNVFWSRWRTEYIQSLQTRQKWVKPRRNLQVGDIVLLVDENVPRGKWTLCRIEEVYPSEDGFVRKVKLRLGDSRLDDNGKRVESVSFLNRPVQKLVLLLENK